MMIEIPQKSRSSKLIPKIPPNCSSVIVMFYRISSHVPSHDGILGRFKLCTGFHSGQLLDLSRVPQEMCIMLRRCGMPDAELTDSLNGTNEVVANLQVIEDSENEILTFQFLHG